MKKIILTIAIVLGIGFGVSAQSDAFFASNASSYTEYREDTWGELPLLPSQHNMIGDYKAAEAPIGTGLLLLAGMGLGYAALRKKD